MSFLRSIGLILLCALMLSSFSARKRSVFISVFYYDNSKGAYTLPHERIISHYQKKSVISDRKSITKISDEISRIEQLDTIEPKVLKSCNFVICYQDQNGNTKMVGFNNQRSMIHIENKSYEAPKRLLRIIKRRCCGHWS
ncbi:hypothetical protein [Fluviicola sp.]|uniref:hypothetical protein n=1 Tax=Fluviicola sp. TaxID=1917219 RepID=UPI0031D96AE3